MIKNYAGFSTDLEDEKLVEYLEKEMESCLRLSTSYINKASEISKCINKLLKEMSFR